MIDFEKGRWFCFEEVDGKEGNFISPRNKVFSTRHSEIAVGNNKRRTHQGVVNMELASCFFKRRGHRSRERMQ